MPELPHETSGKKLYASPKLTVYGNVQVITQALGSGDFTDASFEAKTPGDELTFSDM